jgi:glycosyltransferase involved in cell wall biosynthesis
MKIVYLSTARIPDDWGHVIQIMKMCEAFARAGHAVELVVPHRAGTSREDPYAFVGAENIFNITKLACIDVSATSEGKWLYWLRIVSFFLSAQCYLAFKRYDVLYTREPFIRFGTMPYVFEAHSVSPSVIRAAKKARAVIAITSFIRDELVEVGVPQENILVAPDAVDLSTFENPESTEVARKRLDIPLDKKIALYLGRIDAWKGTDALFGAADFLPDDIQLVVIGAEPHEINSLQETYPRIRFIAFRPYREVADNQAAADVLLLPNTARNTLSARYTSPLKLFSYMASGKPIVASDIPSIREILNEQNAFLIEPDSAAALADGIQSVIENPDDAHTRAVQARTDVAVYTWNARAQGILEYL